MKQVATVNDEARALEQYDPDQALKEIAVSEAAEKHWRRAKDARKLFEAINTKLMAQAEYVVWRDRVVVPSQQDPVLRGKRAGVSEPKSPLPAADPGAVVIHRWRKRLCTDGNVDSEKLERATEIDLEKIKRALEEAGKRAQQIVEFLQAASYSSESNEWYTPSKYIAAVREALGDIDLDPASSAQANATVRAKDIFTQEDDGLARDWFGRVFVNPPYGRTPEHRSLAAAFCNKAVSEYASGNVESCIILVNSLHSQTWQAPLYDHTICFVDHRIHFVSADGEENENPTFQNVFVYLGRDVAKFAAAFSGIGYVMRQLDLFAR